MTTLVKSKILHSKQFFAAARYWFDDVPIIDAMKEAELIVEEKEEVTKSEIKKAPQKLNKSKREEPTVLFETHVVCTSCNSLNLKVSKIKIKCNACGKVDLVENIRGT